MEDLQEFMNEFYIEYEDSYIDENTHGVIVLLINELQENNLLSGGEWDDFRSSTLSRE